MDRYFATRTDDKIIVRAANSIEDFKFPSEWEEVLDVWKHVNERGLDALDCGKQVVFTPCDISYRQLASLFSDE